jgi:hypothetical protein
MICPKCEFQQDEAAECVRCGLIIARYRSQDTATRLKPETHGGMMRPKFPLIRNFYRIFRWVALAAVIMSFTLILKNSKPPSIEIPPDAGKRAEEKIRNFQSAAAEGSEQTLRINESELNGFLRENLALKKPLESTTSTVGDTTNTIDTGDATLEQVQSSVRDVKIELREDSLRLYAVFDLYGMDQTLELEGTVTVLDGYLRLNPTSGKLGSFPLMAGTLRRAADRIFNSPENKEKFHLPPYIKEIRIEHGQFIITSE